MKRLLVTLAISLIGLTGLLKSVSKAYALSGNEFKAGRIMDDSIFFNGGTLDTASIQAFLNSKVPTCDTNGTQARGSTTRAAYGTSVGYPPPYTCLKSYSVDTPTKTAETGLCGQYNGGTKSTAQIISDVGQACGVNPKVLIVLLEKEQSLITDDWPWSIQYRSATGYGCPDTAACDTTYYGFFNQVYNAARQFKRYSRDATLFSYRSGRDNYIQYNPNTTCGGSNVFIYSQATAGLYNYTPYQPNASALSNLYGSGDSCGAYGNRNFWRLYNDWFGSTTSVKLSGNPGSVSWGNGRVDVFIRGTDGYLWQKYYDANGSGWGNWAFLNVPTSTSPTVTTWGVGRLDIFYADNTGSLQHYWYGNGAWQSIEPLDKPSPTVSIVGSPSAVSWVSGRIDVFARGSDDGLWQKTFDTTAGDWQSWVKIGGGIATQPTVSSWGESRLDVFATGVAGDLMHFWHNNNVWSGPETLSTPSTSVRLSTAPGAVSWGNARIDVFGRGTDGVLWQKWFDKNGWHAWGRFSGVLSSSPTISSWKSERLDLFSTGPAGDLQHFWFGGYWGNWESFGQPVY